MLYNIFFFCIAIFYFMIYDYIYFISFLCHPNRKE